MLVSVYLPTKNRLALLQRAVASVLAQTHEALELIVADDGSTDGTAHWLAQLSAQDARVHCIRHAQSRGAPAARNQAIRQARGEWITGLDDDDRFLPDRLARFVAHAARLDAAGTRYSGLYACERIESARGVQTLRKPAAVGFESLFHYNPIGNQIFARRAHYLAAGLFDEAMPAWQDLDLFLRMVHQGGPAQRVAHCTYVLADDARADRISRQHKSRLLQAHARIVAKWPDVHAVHKQRLYLQLLAPFYGFALEASDLRRYFAYGVSPAACARLAQAVARRLGASLRPPRLDEVLP